MKKTLTCQQVQRLVGLRREDHVGVGVGFRYEDALRPQARVQLVSVPGGVPLAVDGHHVVGVLWLGPGGLEGGVGAAGVPGNKGGEGGEG